MACKLSWEFFSVIVMWINLQFCHYSDATLANWTSAFKLEDDHQEVTVVEGVTRPLVCEIQGYPSDDLTFVWLNNSKEISQESSVTTNSGEMTASTLHFQGNQKDHHTEITCRIFLKDSTNSVSNRSVKVTVLYKPVVQIHYSQDSSEEVYEQDDVTFMCFTTSNPSPTTLFWYHDGKVINETNAPRNVEYLTLKRLNRFGSGNYACQAVNAIGSGTSESIIVNVRYDTPCEELGRKNQTKNGHWRPDWHIFVSPVCAMKVKPVYFLQEGQRLNISCDVAAYPDPQSFSWESNINESLSPRSGTIMYEVPSVHLDNTLYCWARNEVGEQEVKCTIKLVQATSPEPVTECQMKNSSTLGMMDLVCQAGGDGGLQMSFTIIIQDVESDKMIFQESNGSTPNVTIAGLEGDRQYNVTVISSNNLGAQPFTFMYYHEEHLTSLWKPQTILTFLLLLGVIVVILLGVTIYCKCSRIQGSHRLPEPVNREETEIFLENGNQPAHVTRRPDNGIAPRASVESLTYE